MNSFQFLYDTILVGEKPGAGTRLRATAAALVGAFNRLPTVEMTTPEFMKTLVPSAPSTIGEYLQEERERPRAYGTVSPEMIPQALVAAADEALARHFPLLGTNFRFDGRIDWFGGYGDEALHWSKTLEGKSAGAETRPIRELNRHKFFVTLALAAVKTGEDKYVRGFNDVLHSWCDWNPPETGFNYVHGTDIGIRCIAWIFADGLLKDFAAYDAVTRERLQRNLYAQARHLAEYLSYAEETGRNHRLIVEAASLAYIGLSFPEWRDAEKWIKRGLSSLWSTFDEQIYPDGMHFEASFGYHLLVAECMFLIFAEMRRQKRPVPSKAYALLQRMTTVLRLSRQPDGTLPNINDDDGSVALPLDIPQKERIEGLLASAAVLFDRPDYKAAAGIPWPLYGQLLLGDAGAEDYRVLANYADDFSGLATLNNARIHIIRRGGDFVLFKNNPDPAPQSGHNHADLLSLLLWFDGKPLLVDAGTYRFADDKGFRNALRSTFAHNTVAVDMHDQSEPEERYLWSYQLKPGLTEAIEEDGVIIIDGQHDSFERIGVTHRRVVLWLKDVAALVVIDQMQGHDTHFFTQSWHFAPGLVIADAGAAHYRLEAEGKPLAHIQFLREKETDAHEIMSGTERNKSSNVSLSYGALDPAPVINHSWTSTLKPGNSAHRITVFSKTEIDPHFAEVFHAEFRLFGWRIDVSQTPAKVERSKD